MYVSSRVGWGNVVFPNCGPTNHGLENPTGMLLGSLLRKRKRASTEGERGEKKANEREKSEQC